MKDIKQLVKEKLFHQPVEYPEKAVYESFFKQNADKWFNPKKCDLHKGHFGISVIPKMLDNKVHNRLELTIFRDGKKHIQRTLLTHQIYLHNLVFEMWDAEGEEEEIKISIKCIRKDDEVLIITPKNKSKNHE